MQIYTIHDWKEVSATNSLSSTTDMIKIPKSREEGESDLAKIARTNEAEVTWMYSPTDSVWYNCTHEQKNDSSRSNRPLVVSIVPEGLDELGREFDFYHTHPKKSIDAEIVKQQSVYVNGYFNGKPNPELRLRFAKHLVARFQYVASALPSCEDVIALFNNQERHPDKRITENIVCDYGILNMGFRFHCFTMSRDKLVRSLDGFLDDNFHKIATRHISESKGNMLSREAIQEGISKFAKELTGEVYQIALDFKKID